MTREEMAEAVIEDGFYEVLNYHTRREIAAELRKSCSMCSYFRQRVFVSPLKDEEDEVMGWCDQMAVVMPLDGSGFCHQYKCPEVVRA